MQYISRVHLSYNNENIIGASEASPLVSHARGPGGVCMYVCLSWTGRLAWTGIRYLLL